jgi:hypothetical protein
MGARKHAIPTVYLWLLGIVFLYSGYVSWDEWIYTTSGTTASARVVRMYDDSTSGRRGTTKLVAVEYEFTDKDGSIRREEDRVYPDRAKRTGDTVMIRYLSGVPGRSRLEENEPWGWIGLFFLCAGLVVFKVGVYCVRRVLRNWLVWDVGRRADHRPANRLAAQHKLRRPPSAHT